MMQNSKTYTFEDSKEIVTPIIQKYREEKVILFRSYARKEVNENSDIDIMVIEGNYFEPTGIFYIADEIYGLSEKKSDVYEKQEINADSDFYRTILADGFEPWKTPNSQV